MKNNFKTFILFLIGITAGVVGTLYFTQSDEPEVKSLTGPDELEPTPQGKTFICNVYYNAVERITIANPIKRDGIKPVVVNDNSYIYRTGLVAQMKGKFMPSDDTIIAQHKTLLPNWYVDTLLDVRRPIKECELVDL